MRLYAGLMFEYDLGFEEVKMLPPSIIITKSLFETNLMKIVHNLYAVANEQFFSHDDVMI